MQQHTIRMNSDQEQFKNCCCCAPYPVLDLTKAFSGNGNGEEFKDLKHDASAACARFGCFHVKISPTNIESSFNYDFMKVLDSENAVKKCLESIFDDKFVDSQTEGKATVSVPSRTSDGNITTAKYRGRTAESGSATSLEPKQSWEVLRCRRIEQSPFQPTNKNTEEAQLSSANLSILHDYVRVLHEVAICLFSKVLDLPETFIDDRMCECNNLQSADCPCTMDLLRAFRYDALTSSEMAEANLGSSPHTDWGSLTVVWQDSKGGLQIYCHEHEKWNNVEAVNDSSDGTVSLFIHVGDFTSLSLSQAVFSSPKQLTWPSPLHRVVCPLRTDETDATDENDVRFSLVYFCYPPGLTSLDDSQKYVHSQKYVRNKMVGGRESNEVGNSSFPYDRYMVLNDQSPGSGSVSSKEVYHRIKKVPFREVIEAKWQQVQRR